MFWNICSSIRHQSIYLQMAELKWLQVKSHIYLEKGNISMSLCHSFSDINNIFRLTSLISKIHGISCHLSYAIQKQGSNLPSFPVTDAPQLASFRRCVPGFGKTWAWLNKLFQFFLSTFYEEEFRERYLLLEFRTSIPHLFPRIQ